MKQNYEIITLKEFIEKHPEIEHYDLLTTWESGIISEDDEMKGIRIVGTGQHIDSEYSYTGGRQGALEFSEEYSCWDEVYDTLDAVPFGYRETHQEFFPEENRILFHRRNMEHDQSRPKEYIHYSQVDLLADAEVHINGDWVRVTGDVAFKDYSGKMVCIKDFLKGHPEIDRLVDLHVRRFYMDRILESHGGCCNCIMSHSGNEVIGKAEYIRSHAIRFSFLLADSEEEVSYVLPEKKGCSNNIEKIEQRVIGTTLVRTVYFDSTNQASYLPSLPLELTTDLRFGPFDDDNKAHHEVVL